jgi:hypothetical protein
MSIGTILLIAGAVGVMLLMHRVGHGGHAAAHGAHGGGGAGDSTALPAGGRSPTGGDAPDSSLDADEHSGHGGRGGETPAADEPQQKKHGCC